VLFYYRDVIFLNRNIIKWIALITVFVFLVTSLVSIGYFVFAK